MFHSYVEKFFPCLVVFHMHWIWIVPHLMVDYLWALACPIQSNDSSRSLLLPCLEQASRNLEQTNKGEGGGCYGDINGEFGKGRACNAEREPSRAETPRSVQSQHLRWLLLARDFNQRSHHVSKSSYIHIRMFFVLREEAIQAIPFFKFSYFEGFSIIIQIPI